MTRKINAYFYLFIKYDQKLVFFIRIYIFREENNLPEDISGKLSMRRNEYHANILFPDKKKCT